MKPALLVVKSTVPAPFGPPRVVRIGARLTLVLGVVSLGFFARDAARGESISWISWALAVVLIANSVVLTSRTLFLRPWITIPLAIVTFATGCAAVFLR
jgi:hypothetical protein